MVKLLDKYSFFTSKRGETSNQFYGGESVDGLSTQLTANTVIWILPDDQTFDFSSFSATMRHLHAAQPAAAPAAAREATAPVRRNNRSLLDEAAQISCQPSEENLKFLR